MGQNLEVALIQKDLAWEDKPGNLRQFQELIAQIPSFVDLVVLPEMFTTGFSMNAVALAESMEGPTLSWLHEMATTYQFVITGSIIIRENGRYHNRLIWMPPDGQFEYYDKRHLFTFADEHYTYTPGKKRLITEIKGWKVLPLVCYDLRFPVWSRNSEDYDLLLYVANFPEKRQYAWKQLLIARAIENQVYTLGVNRVGIDGNDISYSGDSMVLDYGGRVISSAAYIETVQHITLSFDQQKAYRERFAFLPDRDQFEVTGP